MFFSTSLASLLSQNTPIVDLKYRQPSGFQAFNPQQLFPLPQFPFEAHAPGNLKRRDHTSLDLLAALFGSLTRGAKLPARPVEMSREGVMLAGLELGQQLSEERTFSSLKEVVAFFEASGEFVDRKIKESLSDMLRIKEKDYPLTESNCRHWLAMERRRKRPAAPKVSTEATSGSVSAGTEELLEPGPAAAAELDRLKKEFAISRLRE